MTTRDEGTVLRHRLACALAREAGAMAAGYFAAREALHVETKDDPQDVVSEADRKLETLIRSRIAAAFPDDAILGEEGGATAGRSGFGWLVDPIDGTMPFLSGLPSWCVALVVTFGEEAVACATFAPCLETLWDAQAGAGARRNGRSLSLARAGGLTARMTAIGASHRVEAQLLGAVISGLLSAGGSFFRHGSGALMLAQVADGSLAGYYEPHMHPWDARGGLLLVAEAGGRMRAYTPTGGPVLAACPAAYDVLAGIVDAAGG